jgi:hypothetical protein
VNLNMATVVAYDSATGVASVIAPDLYGQTTVDALPYRRNNAEPVVSLLPGDKVLLMHDKHSRSPMWFAGDAASTAMSAVTANYATTAGSAVTADNAANAGLLDGIDSTDFVRKTGNQVMAGNLTAPRFIPNTYVEASFPAGNYIGETLTATDTKRSFVWNGTVWGLIDEPLSSWTITSAWQGGWVPLSSNGWFGRTRNGLMIAAGTFSVNTTTGGVAGNAIYLYPPSTLAYGNAIWGSGYYFDAGNTIYHIKVNPAPDSPTTQFNLNAHGFGDRLGLAPSFAMAQNDLIHIQIMARI